MVNTRLILEGLPWRRHSRSEKYNRNHGEAPLDRCTRARELGDAGRASRLLRRHDRRFRRAVLPHRARSDRAEHRLAEPAHALLNGSRRRLRRLPRRREGPVQAQHDLRRVSRSRLELLLGLEVAVRAHERGELIHIDLAAARRRARDGVVSLHARARAEVRESRTYDRGPSAERRRRDQRRRPAWPAPGSRASDA